jgi:hypothetical protein
MVEVLPERPIRPWIRGRLPGHSTYHAWAPLRSPLQVEYCPDILRDVQLEDGSNRVSGVLLGKLHGNTVRLLAARRSTSTAGPRLGSSLEGVSPIGIFVTRVRGEIFLTEFDLELFDQERAVVALVVVGDKGGFFVREADGSIQAIQSHEEFALDGTPLLPSSNTNPAKPIAWSLQSRIAAIVILGFMASIAVVASQWHRPAPSLGLILRDESGLLHIAWKPSSIRHFTLEVMDGSAHVTLPLAPRSRSVTYARRTSDVEVRLTAQRPFTSTLHESTRLMNNQPPPASERDKIRAEIAFFDAESRVLHAKIDDFRAQIAQSQKSVNSVLRELRQQNPAEERSPAE